MSKDELHQNSNEMSQDFASNDHSNSGDSNHSGAEEPTIVEQIVSDLGDHREFTVFNKKLFDLPVILYDDGGFKFYSGVHSMEEAGEYEFYHHKIVKAGNHEEHPTLDLSITNFLAFQLISALFLIFIFGKVRSAYKKNPKGAPKGLQNAVEALILFVRDDIVRSNIPVRRLADSLTPYFITLFFFIYTMNLIGLLPGGHTPTSSLAITTALAITAFLVINIYQIKQEGVGGYLKHLTAGSPWFVWVIMIPIEIAGIIIKPAVLAIRLFANMSAGHIILFSFIGMIIMNGLGGTPFTLLALFVYVLELLVTFIQAYIFVLLTAIFLGLGLHDEHEHAH